MNKYTEAIQGDDVVILCDGIPMGVGEILAALNAATPPADAALSSVVIPAGCVCTTKANDMAALIESAICDAELERIIEESDARWTEDMFHVHGGELMDMLRKAAAIRARQEVAVPDDVAKVLEEITEALAARLGTNAAEWPLVRRAFSILAAKEKGK